MEKDAILDGLLLFMISLLASRVNCASTFIFRQLLHFIMAEFSHHLPHLREIVLSHGYHGTTLRMLTKVLNITEKELYKSIGGKKELFKLLILNERDIWHSYIEEARSKSTSATNQITELLNIIEKEHLHRQQPKGSLLANLAGELQSGDRDLQSLIAAQYDLIGKDIAELLKDIDLQASGRKLALFILASIEGSIMLAKSDNDFWEMRNGFMFINQYLDLLQA